MADIQDISKPGTPPTPINADVTPGGNIQVSVGSASLGNVEFSGAAIQGWDAAGMAVYDFVTSNINTLNAYLEALRGILDNLKDPFATNVAYETVLAALETEIAMTTVPADPGLPPDTTIPVIPQAPDGTFTEIKPVITTEIPRVPQGNISDMGDFTDQMLPVNIPSDPNPPFPSNTATLGTIIGIDIPSALDVTVPDAPPITSIVIPAMPDFNYPVFSGVEPVLDLADPNVLFTWNEADYNDDVLSALQLKILDMVVNGGTGLAPDVEQAIYDRARSRQEDEEEASYTEALSFFSSRGFRTPPGALGGRLIEVRNKIQRSTDDLNNDILVNQAKLAQENTHFFINSALHLEDTLINFWNQRVLRTLEAQKFIVDTAIRVYEEKIKLSGLKIEVYKTEAQVFETLMKAEAIKADVYKAQIEGVKAQVEVDNLIIERYKAQLSGVQTLVDIYKARMQVAQIQTEINKITNDIYKTQIDAYVAQVNAYTSRYNAYTAVIAGEAEKVKIYEAQVSAYLGKVQAFKVRCDTEIARVNSYLDKNKVETQIFSTMVDKFKTDWQAIGMSVDANVKDKTLQLQAWDTKVKKYIEEYKVTLGEFQARIEQRKNQIQLLITDAESQLKVWLEAQEKSAEISEFSSKVLAQLMTGAMGIIHASSDLAFHETSSAGVSAHGQASSSLASQDHTESFDYRYHQDTDS